MPTVQINGAPHKAREGERLSALLARCGIAAEHPCGGRGTCGKCTVTVNGQRELSCQYIIRADAVVDIAAPEAIAAEGAPEVATPQPVIGDCELALDVGSTTLALAAVDRRTGDILRVVTANNPQRAYGADVMSRIAYARQNGVEPLTTAVRAAIDHLIETLRAQLWPADATDASLFDRLWVAGNTTMLHLLLGVDPTPMGTAPYTPVFLDQQRHAADAVGLHGVREVITLPGMAAFVGADLTAGAYSVGLPPAGQYRLLVDLGTNAEILLLSQEGILCTAAAAGPCFEGASISCGMSATPGAIAAYEPDGTYTTIGHPDGREAPACGVCGTGLVDAVAALLEREVIDETGYMESDAFYLTDTVALTQEDIRQYQLAKSAVSAAIEALLHQAGVPFSAIDRLCIAGGFAAKLHTPSAVRTGLLPAALADRCVPVGNTSLIGTARYTALGGDLTGLVSAARYIDLAADPFFSERFMEGMLF